MVENLEGLEYIVNNTEIYEKVDDEYII